MTITFLLLLVLSPRHWLERLFAANEPRVLCVRRNRLKPIVNAIAVKLRRCVCKA